MDVANRNKNVNNCECPFCQTASNLLKSTEIDAAEMEVKNFESKIHKLQESCFKRKFLFLMLLAKNIRIDLGVSFCFNLLSYLFMAMACTIRYILPGKSCLSLTITQSY